MGKIRAAVRDHYNGRKGEAPRIHVVLRNERTQA